MPRLQKQPDGRWQCPECGWGFSVGHTLKSPPWHDCRATAGVLQAEANTAKPPPPLSTDLKTALESQRPLTENSWKCKPQQWRSWDDVQPLLQACKECPGGRFDGNKCTQHTCRASQWEHFVLRLGCGQCGHWKPITDN